MRATLIALLILAACNKSGDSQHDDSRLDSVTLDAPLQQADAPQGSGSGTATYFTIVLENHDYKEVVGSSNAPYINSLIAKYALATNYKDTGHPSTPNYLNMMSGSNQYGGGIDLLPTAAGFFPTNQPNLATQLEAANMKWRSYDESVGTPGCVLKNMGEYVPRHVPFLYFTDQQKGANDLCVNTNVDYAKNFATDLATNTYRYMYIAPNLIDDGHDPTNDPVTGLKDADKWMSENVPMILASQGYLSGGVLFITWDEAEGRNGDDPDLIPMIVVSTRVKTAGMTSATAYTHSSHLATVEDLLGLPRLATVTNTPSMEKDFLNP
jgi:hypothetical protein